MLRTAYALSMWAGGIDLNKRGGGVLCPGIYLNKGGGVLVSNTPCSKGALKVKQVQ